MDARRTIVAERDAQVLRRRAEQLARPAAQQPLAPHSAQALAFTVAGQPCLLELDCVRQVQLLRELTPIPLAPPALLGLQPWRARMLPVLDLALLLGLTPHAGATAQRLLVLGRREAVLAVPVDEVHGLQPVAPAQAQARSRALEGVRPELVRGITAAGQLLLDGPRLLAPDRIAAP